jgi:hypothetical protein
VRTPSARLSSAVLLLAALACSGEPETMAPTDPDQGPIAAAQAGTRVIDVSPGTNPVSFGTVQSPFESATPTTQTFTVTNVGTKVTSGLAVSITGAGAAAYSIKSGDDGCTGRSLALSGKNKSCSVKVTFAPSAAGSFSAALNVTVAQPKATVLVNLGGTGANATSIVVRSAVTGADVSVSFTTTGGLVPATFALSNGGSRTYQEMAPGSYTVSEVTPAGHTLISLDCTFLGAGTSASTSLSLSTASITIASGGSIDCTFTTTAIIATLSGTVFDDPDLSGTKGAAEPGHGDVTVNLKDGAGTTTLQTTTTGSDGSYAFTTATGSYRIEVVAPAGTAITTSNTQPRSLTVSSATVSGLDVGVNTFNIRTTARACSSDNSPVAGVSVQLFSFATGADDKVTTADGTATWLGPMGDYNLHVPGTTVLFRVSNQNPVLDNGFCG